MYVGTKHQHHHTLYDGDTDDSASQCQVADWVEAFEHITCVTLDSLVRDYVSA